MRRLLAVPSLFFLVACDAVVSAEAETKTEVVADQAAAVAVGGDAVVVAGGEAAVVAGGDAAVAVDASAIAAANVDAKLEIQADAFKLERVTALVQEGTIETAAELELAINDPEAEINRIDIDADGEIDHVEVIEVRGD